MKGPIKSALSVALAMAASQAFALGLGPIQIKSGLNQPLLAEIPIVADAAAETEDLRVDLASAEDFQRVGLSRARVTVPIEFTVATSGHGKVIRVTTKEAVREPFLDFLIEASWSKGKLLREYTVLLDPPVTAPAVLATAAKPAEKPKPVEAAPRAPVSASPAAEAPRPVAQTPAPAPRPAQAAPPPAAAARGTGEYTVQHGDTLSQIASEHVDDSRDFNRMLLALYKANPDAFSGNMNALKTGAVLRIPAADEVRAVGSLREAAAAVRAQQQSWKGESAATLIANTGAAPAAEKQTSGSVATQPTAKSERLALVPPSGAGGDTGASPGGSGGAAKDSAALRADLARTKEALSNREQETTELKSRVSQLEDINGKSQRLISLKDSEIADLQNKLKQLQSGKAETKPADTASTAKPAASTPSTAPAAASSAAPAPVAATPASAPATPAPSAATEPPAAAPPSSTTVSTSQPGAVTAPATPAGSAPAPASTAPAKPPVVAAAKPAAAPAESKPWYTGLYDDNRYALYGAGGILVLLAGWLLTRASGKKKVNPRPALTATDTATESADTGHDDAEAGYHDADAAAHGKTAQFDAAPLPDDEMEQLRRHFDDGDADRFLALAHSLHEKLPEDSVEWHEVSELGRQLLPGSPLFAESAHAAHDGHDPDEFFFETESGVDHGTAAHAQADAQAQAHDAAMLDQFEPLPFEPHGNTAHESGELADLEFEREFSRHVDHVESGAEHLVADHEPAEGRPAFLDEDTIGTRLDLARAYLDMGDPEGARSMLEEVIAEGNDEQKDEARKLLAELG